jgi:hypothetical protein
MLSNSARLRKRLVSALDVQIADRSWMREELRCGQMGFYCKGLALTPNWFATGRQTYTAPGEAMLAPLRDGEPQSTRLRNGSMIYVTHLAILPYPCLFGCLLPEEVRAI